MYACSYDEIISIENLLAAWQEFVVGKRSRKDTQAFEQALMQNIFTLHESLSAKTYEHSPYEAFRVSDPKPRSIHKAIVVDRVLHRALYRKLYPFFDSLFIADSYSCREDKGTHRALNRFRALAAKVSWNHTRTCWVLKCDIRKFFASIDHSVLLRLLTERIQDKDVSWLLREVIGSFSSAMPGVGLPLGNLTSQLFSNVYMNQFDQFVKHRLKVRYYVRYADDFVFLSEDRNVLIALLSRIRDFLSESLRLTLHPDKIFLQTFSSGIDFLGWVHFPDHRVLRPATNRRAVKAYRDNADPHTLASYRGLLRHGNTAKLSRFLDQLENQTNEKERP